MSYQSPTDYSRDFVFGSTIGYQVTQFVPDDGRPNAFMEGKLLQDATVRLAFFANPEKVDFSYASTSVTFAGAELTTPSPQRLYQRGDIGLALGPVAGRTMTYVTQALAARYLDATTANGVNGRNQQLSYGFVGPVSDASEMLPDFLGYSGVVFVGGGAKGTTNLPRGRTTLVSITPSSSSPIAGSFPLVVVEDGAERQKGTLRLEGAFDRSGNRVNGTLSDSENGLSGTFQGQLFGPNRAEIAIVFRFTRASDEAEYVGDFLGRR